MQELNKTNAETLSETKLLSTFSSFLLNLIIRDSMCSCCENASQLGYIVKHEKSGILKAVERPRVSYPLMDNENIFRGEKRF